jgi:hypothetical protein
MKICIRISLFFLSFCYGCTFYSSSSFINDFSCDSIEKIIISLDFAQRLDKPIGNSLSKEKLLAYYQITLTNQEKEQLNNIFCSLLNYTRLSSNDTLKRKKIVSVDNSKLISLSNNILVSVCNISLLFSDNSLGYRIAGSISDYSVESRHRTFWGIPLGKSIEYASATDYTDERIDSCIVQIINTVLRNHFENGMLSFEIKSYTQLKLVCKI